LLAAFLSLVGCTIQADACTFHLAPLVVLGGSQYLSVFKLEQLQALALLSLKLHAQAFSIGLVFFGFYCFLIGYVIFRSTFLPRIGGLLMAFAGLSYLTLTVCSARKLSVHLHSGPPWARGRIADSVAPRDGRERTTMEGAGQLRGGHPHMKFAIYRGSSNNTGNITTEPDNRLTPMFWKEKR
jgi:Domain of unknown function (DUF4386)